MQFYDRYFETNKDQQLYKDLVLNTIYQYGYAIIYYGFSLSCSLIKVYFIQT